jgi:hypothetical protein
MSADKNYRIITIGMMFPWSTVGFVPVFSMTLCNELSIEKLENILKYLKITKTNLVKNGQIDYDSSIENITTDIFLQQCGKTLECNFWKIFEDTNFIFCRKVNKLQRNFVWNGELYNHEIVKDMITFLNATPDSLKI